MANVKFSALPSASALAAVDIFCVSQGGISEKATIGQIIDDTAYGAGWNGQTVLAPSKNAIYDQLHKIDTADDGTIVNAGTGYRIAGAAASGKILIGNGTNYVASTPTYPNASATALKYIRSDGTNWIASTATISDTPGTAGKVLISDGTNWITSTPTFPNVSATSRKFIISDGTNWVASTETWATPGAAGNVLVSDGTNWISKSARLNNGSIAQQALSTTDIYVTGSVITIPAGAMTAGTTYGCLLYISKTAGTGTIIMTLRIGTLGTTGDAAICTLNMGGAGTSASDIGKFEIYANFRAVGASAQVIGWMILTKQLTTTGLINTSNTTVVGGGVLSSTFNSTTATKIGLSFNGSTAFAGNCELVQAEYKQP